MGERFKAMGKPNYTGAKAYFTIIEAASLAFLLAGFVAALIVYRQMGPYLAGATLAFSFLVFISSIAVSQIGRATINMAEDTRRMADMMQADRKSRREESDQPVQATSSGPDRLVARR
jgi:hypothetical protein